MAKDFTRGDLERTSYDSWMPSLASTMRSWSQEDEEIVKSLEAQSRNPGGGEEWTGDGGQAAQDKAHALGVPMLGLADTRDAAADLVEQAYPVFVENRQKVLDQVGEIEKPVTLILGNEHHYDLKQLVRVTDDWRIEATPEAEAVVANAPVEDKDDLVQRIQQMGAQDAVDLGQRLQAFKDADDTWTRQLVDAVHLQDAVDNPAQDEDPLLGVTAEQARAAALAYADGTADEETRKRVEAAMQLSQRESEQLAAGQPTQLTPQQSAVLQVMQQQLGGKSSAEIKALADKYGPNGGKALGNALEMMGNSNVRAFPPGGTGPVWQGGMDKLPEKVRDTVTQTKASWDKVGYSPDIGDVYGLNLSHGQDMQDLCAVLGASDPGARQGTALDQAVADRAREVLHTQQHPPDGPFDNVQTGGGSQDPAIQAMLGVVAPDHQVVHDELRGPKGQEFLDDLTHNKWTDDGNAAGAFLNQGQNADAGGHQGQLSGESERTIANYFASHPELNKQDGHTFGENNPGLAEGAAKGLAPYIGDLTGSPLAHHGDSFGQHFDSDTDHNSGLSPNAKEVIALLSSDDRLPSPENPTGGGAAILKEAMNRHEVQLLGAMAEAEHRGDQRAAQKYLEGAERTQAIVDRGIYDGLVDHYHNADKAAAQAYAVKSAVWDSGKGALSLAMKEFAPGLSLIASPVLDSVNSPLKSMLLGDAPGATSTGTFPHQDPVQFKSMVAQALYANHPETQNPLIAPDGHVYSQAEWQNLPHPPGTHPDDYSMELDKLLDQMNKGMDFPNLTRDAGQIYSDTANNNGKPPGK